MRLSDLSEALDHLDFQDQTAHRCSCEAHECGLAWDALRRIDRLWADESRVAGRAESRVQEVLGSALGLVGAETLLWVPAEREQPATVLGKRWIAQREARQLLAGMPAEARQRDAVYLCNDPMAESWSAAFYELVNVLCVRAGGSGGGWLIAINRPGGFHPRHAAVLTPFAALAARGTARSISRQRAISVR